MDLLDLFVLNIPFESLQQMEFKTKMAKSLLFDPAETLRRNKANNEGCLLYTSPSPRDRG